MNGYTIKPLLITGLLLVLVSFFSSEEALDRVAKALARYRQLYPQEKVFLHLNQSYYLAGEPVYFKGYLMDVDGGMLQNNNAILYVALAGEEGPVQTLKVLAKEGLAQGQLLLPANLKNGLYTLTAYTNSMRNLPKELSYQASFRIYQPKDPKAIRPKKNSALKLSFYPEGGSLVQGLVAKVAVRATDGEGKGVALSGTVLNSENKEITAFTTDKNGIGTFILSPARGEQYKAAAGGEQWQLPAVQEAGAALQLIEQPDRYKIIVRAAMPKEELLLIAQAQGRVQFYAKGAAKEFVVYIPKEKLPSGLNQLVLFNEQGVPLCQRLVFVEPAKSSLALSLDAQHFRPRQKVTATLSMPGEGAEIAYLSMSVSRRMQEKELSAEDFYLMHELAEGYAPDRSLIGTAALNDFLLTQQWARYNWNTLYDSLAKPAWGPENMLMIKGLLTDQYQKPLPHEAVSVSVPGQFMAYEGLSDETGRLQVPILEYDGNEYVIIQPLKNEASFNKLYFTQADHAQLGAAVRPEFEEHDSFEHAVMQQIENKRIRNAYDINYRSAEDSEDDRKANALQFNKFRGTYTHEVQLKDFVSFPTMREVIREIIPGAYVPMGNNELRIFSQDLQGSYAGNPLFIVDGIPTYNTQAVLALNPEEVERIGVISWEKHLFNFGAAGKYGIMVIQTSLKASAHRFGDKHIVRYGGLDIPADFTFLPPASKRIPDFRSTIHWAPMLMLSSGKNAVIEFYTSDELGEYEVIVRGFTKAGKPVFLEKHFSCGVAN